MTSLGSDLSALRMRPVPDRMQEKIWEVVGWKPHALQRLALLDSRRQIVLSAGRRAGKSQVGGFKLVPEAFRAQAEISTLNAHRVRREFWIVGPEYSDAEKEFRVLWQALEFLGFSFDHPGSYNDPISGNMHISLFDGKFQVHAKSAKYPGTLVGEGLSGVVFSEAAKLKPSVYNKFVRPTLADFGGWAFFSSTPEGHNWFYDFWMNGLDKRRPDWGAYRAPSWVNPYVYPAGADAEVLEKAARLRAESPTKFFAWVDRVGGVLGAPIGIDPEIWSLFLDMSQEMFNQEVAADFTEFIGRVFKDFDEEYHVNSEGIRAGWQTYACCDYGFTNPFVWLLLQVDPFGQRVHVVAEYYERNRMTSEAAAEIRARGLAPSTLLGFYPDPAEPDRTRQLEGEFSVRHAHPGALTIRDRVEWMRRKLKIDKAYLEEGHPERLPGMTINRSCVNLIRELNNYKYPETAEQAALKDRAAPENPIKKDDHAIEALGRFFSGYYGSPWAHARARQTKARVGRKK